jgi:hypothetical protein
VSEDSSWQHCLLFDFRQRDVAVAYLISIPAPYPRRIHSGYSFIHPTILLPSAISSPCLHLTPIHHPSLISYSHFSPSRRLILFLFHSPYFLFLYHYPFINR